MRGERSGGRNLRVEVVTTGLLVRRLQQNPELPGVAAVVIDECHERHLDADLLLAFCVDIRANLRDDLALVATSATADTLMLSRTLAADSPAPVVTASAALFDVAIEWAPPPVPVPLLPGGRVDPRLLDHVAAVVRRALAENDGDILVFVPGEAEINGVTRRLAGQNVLPLFGRQTRAEQDRALAPGAERRIVVTTSVAESSLTVPGVRVVVDSGLAREPRTDQSRGLGALVSCRVSKSSADQRAGWAGRGGTWSRLSVLVCHRPRASRRSCGAGDRYRGPCGFRARSCRLGCAWWRGAQPAGGGAGGGDDCGDRALAPPRRDR